MAESDERIPSKDESAPDPIDLEPVGEAAPEPDPDPKPEIAPEPQPEADVVPEVVEVRITESSSKAPPKQAEGSDPLVRPGMGGAKLALGLGVVLLLGALVASGIRAGGIEGSGARVVALAVAVTLYTSLLHTGTGVAAVMVAARIERRPTGALELAAARMLAAVATFQLVYHLPALIPGTVGLVFSAILGVLAYSAAVWALFRLSRLELGVVVSGHVLLLIAVELGTHLTYLSRSAVEALGAG